MLTSGQGENPYAFLEQGQGEPEPCYVCGGDPAASIQNPEAVLVVPPGVRIPWPLSDEMLTCGFVESLALAGLFGPDLCSLAQNDPIGPRICHCSHLPPEVWLDAYPDSFAYPTVTPMSTPAPTTSFPTAYPTVTPMPTPVPTWKSVLKWYTSCFAVVAVIVVGVLYCSRPKQRAENRTFVLDPPASVVHVTPPVDHEVPFAEAVRLEQGRGGKKGEQNKKPALAHAIANVDS